METVMNTKLLVGAGQANVTPSSDGPLARPEGASRPAPEQR